MRLPNGYGSVFKLAGNRRKPWAVRKTVGWELNHKTKRSKPIYHFVGYYRDSNRNLPIFRGLGGFVVSVFTTQIVLDTLTQVTYLLPPESRKDYIPLSTTYSFAQD